MVDQTITIGTVIHGTLRDEDLLPAFADELGRVSGGAYAELRDTAFRWATFLADNPGETVDPSGDHVGDIVPELSWEIQDALNEYAPSHMYFGAIEGDGADFGRWGVIDYDCETVQLDDENVIDIECQVHIHTNDHGNVTVSELRGKEIWSAV